MAIIVFGHERDPVRVRTLCAVVCYRFVIGVSFVFGS